MKTAGVAVASTSVSFPVCFERNQANGSIDRVLLSLALIMATLCTTIHEQECAKSPRGGCGELGAWMMTICERQGSDL